LIAREKYYEELSVLFKSNEMEIKTDTLLQLANYAYLLAERNKTVNLISRKDIENLIENHIFISALVSRFFPAGISNFVDIGTGGGLPGIPLAIVMQFISALLVDSTKKKYFALQDFIQKLNLKNVTAINSRVEEKNFILQNKNKFDLAISRATVALPKLVEYSLPLLKKKSYIYSLKGGDVSSEIDETQFRFKKFIGEVKVLELKYLPSNAKNEKGKKLITIELRK